jgi:hypothetical protein
MDTLPVSTILNRYEHLMAMYERKIEIEDGWSEEHLIVAMQKLNWVLTGIVPKVIKRRSSVW